MINGVDYEKLMAPHIPCQSRKDVMALLKIANSLATKLREQFEDVFETMNADKR